MFSATVEDQCVTVRVTKRCELFNYTSDVCRNAKSVVCVLVCVYVCVFRSEKGKGCAYQLFLWFTSLISLCFRHHVSLCPLWTTSSPSCQSVSWSVCLSVHLQLLSEFNLTALRQIQIYDLRNEATASPCVAHCAPITAPPAHPLQPLQLPCPPLLSPSAGSQVANNSSHSSNHNQCKATLKVFSVVNAVRALIGGLKSGSQIKYQLRISLKAYMKWWSDDLMVFRCYFVFLYGLNMDT